MANNRTSQAPEPIGKTIRDRRVEVLGKGLREMADLLGVAPAHLTDIEKGRRTPSEELMLRIRDRYGVPEADLRAGWSRAQAIVTEVANQSPTNAEMVPEFLRTARDCTPEQWKALIDQARRISRRK